MSEEKAELYSIRLVAVNEIRELKRERQTFLHGVEMLIRKTVITYSRLLTGQLRSDGK